MTLHGTKTAIYPKNGEIPLISISFSKYKFPLIVTL